LIIINGRVFYNSCHINDTHMPSGGLRAIQQSNSEEV